MKMSIRAFPLCFIMRQANSTKILPGKLKAHIRGSVNTVSANPTVLFPIFFLVFFFFFFCTLFLLTCPSSWPLGCALVVSMARAPPALSADTWTDKCLGEHRSDMTTKIRTEINLAKIRQNTIP